METLLLTFVVFATAVFAMSLGALLGNRSIKGSCGGLSNIPGVKCSACSGHCELRNDASTPESNGSIQERGDAGD